MTDQPQLLPCPCCPDGGKPAAYKIGELGVMLNHLSAKCDQCGLTAPSIKVWNTRPDPAKADIPEKWDDSGAIASNRWNNDAARFVRIVQENPNFWWHDHEVKYLTLRIDTRDGAFILYPDEVIKGLGLKEVFERVSPDRVLKAIREHQEFSRKLNEPRQKPPPVAGCQPGRTCTGACKTTNAGDSPEQVAVRAIHGCVRQNPLSPFDDTGKDI